MTDKQRSGSERVFVWSLGARAEDWYIEHVPGLTNDPEDEDAIQLVPSDLWERYKSAERALSESKHELRKLLKHPSNPLNQ